LEDSADGFRNTLKQPFADLIKVVSYWFRNLAELIFSKERPFRTLGYFLLLMCFMFFVLADAISVANTLVVLGLWAGTLPPLLGRIDLSIFGSSLLALIIGMSLVFEIRSSNSEFSQWSERDERTRALGLGIALFITLLSLIILIAWAFFRLIELGKMDPNPTTDVILNLVIFGFVPINSALAASITFLEALRGFLVIVVLAGWILIGVMQIVNNALTVTGTLVPFLFDILYRLIYIVVDVLQWIITTPVQAIVFPFRTIALTFSGSENVESIGSKRQKK
jgi:hypothetical protein